VRDRRIWPTKGLGTSFPQKAGPSAHPLVHASRCAPINGCCNHFLFFLSFLEDAPTHKKEIGLCYLDFKGAFPSANREQLVRILTFLGLPGDFITIISNLYSGATTEFITPHGHTSAIGIRRGTLQGGPLSPLLFDLMIEPLIRWLTASQRGCDIASCGLQLASK
jgi:hypothetical protein